MAIGNSVYGSAQMGGGPYFQETTNSSASPRKSMPGYWMWSNLKFRRNNAIVLVVEFWTHFLQGGWRFMWVFPTRPHVFCVECIQLCLSWKPVECALGVWGLGVFAVWSLYDFALFALPAVSQTYFQYMLDSSRVFLWHQFCSLSLCTEFLGTAAGHRESGLGTT